MQLSDYSLDRLRDDGEFILYRAHAEETEQPSVLLLAPSSTRPSPETLKKIDHEYSLRSELDSRLGGAAAGPFRDEARRRRSYLKILAAKLSMDSFRGRWR